MDEKILPQRRETPGAVGESWRRRQRAMAVTEGAAVFGRWEQRPGGVDGRQIVRSSVGGWLILPLPRSIYRMQLAAPAMSERLAERGR